MFKLLAVSTLLVVVTAAPKEGAEIGILRNEQNVEHDGTYQWAYETENGINAHEEGQFKQVSKDEGIKSAQGSFGFTSPEGEKIEISYVADENGYQPQGSHIHPIPPIIQKALDWIAAHPEPENKKYN